MENAWKINKREFDEKADRVYEKIKDEIELDNIGKFVAIEPYSGDYFIGNTLIEAGDKAKEKHPDKIFHFYKIGYPAVYSFRRL